jgi:hypothetical protein
VNVPEPVEGLQVFGLIITAINPLAGRENVLIAQEFCQCGRWGDVVLLRDINQCARPLDMTRGGWFQPCQQAKQTRFSAAVTANQRAKGVIQRQIERTKKGIARRERISRSRASPRRAPRWNRWPSF